MMRIVAVMLLVGCSAPAVDLDAGTGGSGGSAGGSGGSGGGTAGGSTVADAGARAICPPDGGWVTLAPISAGTRQETAVLAFNEEIWVLGGFANTTTVVATVQAYNWRTNTWRSDVPPVPAAMHHINAAVVGGKVYVLGGLQGGSFSAVGNSYVFDPGTNQWTTLASMPAGTERGAGAVGVIGTKVIIAGGYRVGSVRDVSSYDTATNLWTMLPSLPTAARDHLVGAVLGDTFFAIGGRNQAIDGRVDALPMGAAAWVPKTAMPTPRAGAAAAVRGHEVVVIGGEGNSAVASGVFPQTEVYDLMNDTWRADDGAPTPKHGTGAATLDGVVFFPGGATQAGFGGVSNNEALCPR